MISDARDIPDGSTITTDICIIGAGAAGVTLGCELAGSGLDVCILESGGLELEADSQELSRGEVDRRPVLRVA